MPFLPSHYDPTLVALSVGTATFASYVALDLAKRVRNNGPRMARNWWIGGSAAMGVGVWSMHFVGMLAYSLPIALGYARALTALSLLAAVLVSAVGLRVAMRSTLGWRSLALASTTMGLGIFAMHYTGMAALDMAPGIVWDPALIAASLAIAIGASAVALLIFFWLRNVSGKRVALYQFLAALVMGAAISGMHYTGMAAASFPFDSICLSADALHGDSLDELVVLGTFSILSLALITSLFDARMQTKSARLAASLQLANDHLAEERERFRALTTLSSDWFWQHDTEQRFTSISISSDTGSDARAEDFIGKTGREMGWIPIDAEATKTRAGQLARREAYRDFEVRRVEPDGRVRFTSNSGMPFYDSAGTFAGYRGVGRDITRRKHQERREHLLHAVTRILNDAASVRDTLPVVIRAVCESCDWPGGIFQPSDAGSGTGHGAASWSGEGTADVFASPALCADDEARNAIASEAAVGTAFCFPVRAGDMHYGDLEFRRRAQGDAEATLDAVRTIASMVGQFIARRDAEAAVREERELLSVRVAERTQQLSESNRELDIARLGAEAASRAKSAFLATMSHEIRTPMNGVVGMIEVLAHGDLDDEQADAVRTIRASGFTLLTLVDDILDFSRIEAGHLELRHAAVALPELVTSVGDLFAAQASARRVDLDVSVSPDAPRRIRTDGTRLRQTLGKLVDNAIKFSAGRDGVRGQVHVRLALDATRADRLALSVSDNGIGIAAEMQAHLFTPFMQAEASTTRRYGGMGMGLVLSQRLVALLGGEIDVRSEPGVGSTFTVSLPIELAGDDEDCTFEPAVPAKHPSVARPAASLHPDEPGLAEARAQGRLLLVAEDDEVNRKVVMKQLSLLGYSAEVANDGAEALRVWHAGGHALLLTDLHMPELDGYGLAGAIRAAEAKATSPTRIPILALTANALRDEAARVRAVGMDAYLTKPIRLDALAEALERWLPKRVGIADAVPEAAPRPSTDSPVDVRVLQSLVGDDMETVYEFLGEFLRAARQQAAEIVAACDADDRRGVESVAHKLKASSRSVGALALGELCAALEHAARAGDQDELRRQRAGFDEAMKSVDACIVAMLAESAIAV